METTYLQSKILSRILLRKNHSGMETGVNGILYRVVQIGCVRTIVVWKQWNDLFGSFLGLGCVRTIVVWKPSPAAFRALIALLRKNHSGMETPIILLGLSQNVFCCVRTIVVWKRLDYYPFLFRFEYVA